jgi:hypothetical protein
MLPPKEVPTNLEYSEYLRLRIRYQTIDWKRQLAVCLKLAILKQPPGGELSEENQKLIAAAMMGLEQLVFFTELNEEFQNSAQVLVDATLDKADKLLDKFESAKKVKSGLVSAFTVLTQTVQETLDDAVESHILPAVGLPVNELPAGKTAGEYMSMADKYIKLGLPEPARKALQKVANEFKDSGYADTAKLKLKTRIPPKPVAPEAQRKFLNALRLCLTQKKTAGKEIYEELIRDYPDFDWPYVYLSCIVLKEGDLERATDLVNRAVKVNPNSLKGWATIARMYLIEWKLEQLRIVIDKINAMEPSNEFAITFNSFFDFIKNQGLE